MQRPSNDVFASATSGNDSYRVYSAFGLEIVFEYRTMSYTDIFSGTLAVPLTVILWPTRRYMYFSLPTWNSRSPAHYVVVFNETFDLLQPRLEHVEFLKRSTVRSMANMDWFRSTRTSEDV